MRRLPAVAVVASALLASLPVQAAPATPPAAAYRPPVPVVQSLDNGLAVAVFPDHRLPIVQIELLIPVGTAADPADRPGTARITAEMLRQGTSSRTAEDFARALDQLGGSMVIGSTRDYTTISARFLARDLGAGLELMSDGVTHPLFADDRLEAVKAPLLAGLSQVLQDPSQLADDQAWAGVFGDLPYGRSTFGTPESVAGITSSQLRAFYYQHFGPGGALLAIAGDVTPERALAAARDWFAPWPAKAVPAADSSASIPVPAASGVRVRLVDAPGLRETQVRLALPAPPGGSADEGAISLAAAILGPGPWSRFSRVGGGDALHHPVRSLYTGLRGAGLFTCATSARNDSAGAAARGLIAELQGLVTQPPDQAELAPLERRAANLYPMQFETLGGVLGRWCVREFYGAPPEEEDRLDSIRPVEFAAAARRWLRPEGVVVVAVGPAAQIQTQLEALGPVTVIRPGAPEATTSKPPTDAQLARGREIVRLALAAHGGLARLRRIKDSTVDATATAMMGGQRVEGHIIQVRKEPYKLLLTSDFGDLRLQQILNGRQAWTTGEGGAMRELDSLDVAGIRSIFEFDLPHLLLGIADPAARLVSRGRERIGDRDADAVELLGEGPQRVYYFDAQTHRLAAVDERQPQGPITASSRRLYGDYRAVGGIQWPYLEERQLDGQRVMIIHVNRVQLNAGVGDEDFQRPEAPLPPPTR